VWKHLAVYGDAEQLSQQIEAELQPAIDSEIWKASDRPAMDGAAEIVQHMGLTHR